MPIHVSTHVTASGDVTASYTSTGSFGRVDATKLYGDGSGITNLPNAAINAYNTSGDDRIITSVNGTTVQGEENLTFDGSTLTVVGNVSASGDITANNYIIKSTVTQVTTSFSDGNTIFGNSMDDTHRFTGSIDVSGSITSFGSGIISASALSSGEQGTITLTTNGVANNVDSGLQVGDSPTFVTTTLSGLTANKIVRTDGSKVIGSADIDDFIAGTANQITVTDDTDGTITLSTPQNLDTSADVTFDSITLDDLTASRLASTDGNKKLVSVNLDDLVAGTTNQITVTDDTDGTITLSTPQNIHTSATPTFAGLTIDGNISASGDVIADNYIVKNTVTQMTQSFSSGSTMFGNTLDDKHEFTGSVYITGSLNVSGSAASTGSFGRIEATTISASLIEVDANTIKIGGQTIDEADATVLNATSGTNTGDITLTGTPDYITITNQVLTRNTIDIGDDTNLAASTGITLTGDTLTTNDAEINHDSLSNFEANEHIDHSNVSITSGTGLSGGGDITTSRTLAVDFTDSTLQSNISGSWRGLISGSAGKISGSLISTGSFGRLETAGDVEINGTLTANTIISNVISQSVAFATGSTIFGDNVADTHKFTGSINITAGGKGAVTASYFKGDGSALTGLTAAAISSYTNAGDNRVITSVNSSTANAEANLTFDGTNLEVLSGNLKVGTPGPSNGIDGIITLYNNTGTATFVLHNQDGNGRFGVSSDNNRTLTFDNQGSGNMSINVQGNVTASGDISGSVTSTGSFAHVHIPDGTSGLGIGNDSDLLLYHNGNHSYIKDNGTGNLYVQGGTQTFQNAAANKTMMVLNAANSVDLYYSNSKKFETTNAGVTITGDLTATNLAGTITTATQNSITTATGLTSVGTIGTGTWEGTTIAVAQGGTGATTLNDLITLGTHSTGNYVATLTGGTGITSTGATSGEGIGHSISVDSSQTQITEIGTIATGVWNGTSISTTYTDAKVTSIVAGDGIDVSGATGDVTVTAEAASDSNPGVVELATTGETTTGTDTTRAVTPDGLKDGYQGSANVTTLGTIGTGTWNGTVITSAYLDSDTAHLTTDQTFSGKKTFSAPITGSHYSGSNLSTGSFGRLQAHTISGNSNLLIDADNFKLEDSGKIAPTGDISGSVASTGSFGRIETPGNIKSEGNVDAGDYIKLEGATGDVWAGVYNSTSGKAMLVKSGTQVRIGEVEAESSAHPLHIYSAGSSIANFANTSGGTLTLGSTLIKSDDGSYFPNAVGFGVTPDASYTIDMGGTPLLGFQRSGTRVGYIQTIANNHLDLSTHNSSYNLRLNVFNNGEIHTGTGKVVLGGSISGSVASTGSFGYLNVPGNAVIGGTLHATQVVSNIVSQSISFATGSNIFGDESTDIHQFTGSIGVTENIRFNGASKKLYTYHLNDANYIDAKNFIANTASDINFQNAVGPTNIVSAGNVVRLKSKGTTPLVASGSNVEFPVTNTKISGSSTSTGSFGDVESSRIRFRGDQTVSAEAGTIGLHTNNYMYVYGGTTGLALMAETGIDGIKILDGGSAGAGSILFETNNAERMRVDGSGNVLIGHTAAITSVGNTMNFQINNASNNNNGISINSWGSNGAHQGFIRFNHSKSGTAGSHTALANTDAIGGIYWQGSDGTDFANSSARIYVDVDGSVAGNRVPGRITFATAEGAADNDILPKMTIRANGKVGIGTTSPENVFSVDGTDNSPVTIKAFGTDVYSGINLITSKGTAASPTDINEANYVIGKLNFMGRESGGNRPGATIQGVTEGTWTGTGHATRLEFYTGPGNIYSMTEKMRIDKDGNVNIISGSISGSSTSTGSFGQLRISNTTNAPMAKLVVGAVAPSAGSSVVAQFDGSIRLENYVIMHDAGNNSNAVGWFYNTNNMMELMSEGSGTSNLYIPGNVSGSSTSTGSFGHIMVGGDNFTTAVSSSAASSGFGAGGSGGVTISNNSNNRVLTGDGTNANAEANLVFDGTKLGVGNTSPSAVLHVDTGDVADNTIEDVVILEGSIGGPGTEGLGIAFSHNGSNHMARIAGTYHNSTSALQGNLDFYTGYSTPSLNMRIDASGHVGIGTTTPTGQASCGALHIYGNHNSNNTILKIEQDGASSSALIQIDSAAGRDSEIQFQENGTNMAAIRNDASADSLILTDGAYSDTLHLKGGNVGIGSTTPAMKLDVAGTTKQQSYTAYYHDDHSTLAGYVGDASAISSLSDDDLFIRSNKDFGIGTNNTGASVRFFINTTGNVGIGTTSPAAKLEIQGANGTVSGTPDSDGDEFVIRNNNDAGMSILAGESSGHTSSIIFGSTSDLNGANVFYEYNTKTMKLGTQHASGILKLRSGNGADAITIDASQNVGIGTTSPDLLLHLNNANGAEMVLQRTAGSTSGLLGGIHFGNADVDDYLSSIYSYQDGATDSAYLSFHTEATGGSKTEKMRITSTGNVGIGTTSPVGKLDVVGTQTLHLTHTTNDDTNKNAVITSYQYDSGTETEGFMMMQSFSNSSTNRIDLGGGNSGHNAVEEIRFHTAANHTTRTGTQRMVIDATGNVGIGVTNPDKKLVVAGDIRATGEIRTSGDIIAENFIVSSSVTYMTQSFSTGNTIFGDTVTDTHKFTGSLDIVMSGSDALTIEGNTGPLFKVTDNASDSLFTVTDVSGVPAFDIDTEYKVEMGNPADPLLITKDSSGNTIISGSTTSTAKFGQYVEASSIAFKTNVETLESPLDKISKLRGVTYNLKSNNEPSIGMIAEEVNEVFPELVDRDDNGNPQAMSYTRMTAVLLEAVKELTEEVKELKKSNIYNKYKDKE